MRLPAFLPTTARAILALFPLTLAVARDQPNLSAEKQASLVARFAGVKAWRITVNYSGDNPLSWEDHGTRHTRSRWTEKSQGSFILPTSEQDETYLRVVGTGRSSDTHDYYRVSRSSAVHEETRYDRAAGVTDIGVDITLNFETGVYEIAFLNQEIPDHYGGTVKDAFTTRRYQAVATTHVTLPIPAPADITLRLPEDGTVIAGSWSWEQAMEIRARTDPGFDLAEYARRQPTRGRLTWTVSPAEIEPLEVELIVEPQGYDTWMPQGVDGRNPGNAIALKAVLVAKDGGPLKQRAVQMTFSLAEVSRERGLALNAPKHDPAASEDLAFEAEKNPGAEVPGGGQSVRFARGPYESTTAILSSYDWGAFGAVVVVARLENGRTVHGHLRGAAVPDVLIPKRAPGSSIADAWKALMGFDGSDGEDEDVQRGNNQAGDGLTAYEEYRGFILDGRHTRADRRLDPKRKDLVIMNELGATGQAGMTLFERASGIHVVDSARTDFPESRLVNANRGHATAGEQYGLRLRTASLKGETAGENRPAAVLNKTPRKSEEAVVDLALAREFFAGQEAIVKAAGERMPYTLEQDITQTIAHELAHGVGAPHHGKTTEYFGKREVTARMVDWKVIGVDGVRVTVTEAKPFDLIGRIGRPGNEASGDVGCIMAYANFYQWAAVGRDGGPYTFYALMPQPLGTHFCTSADATGFNVNHTVAGTIALPGFFGPARGQSRDASPGNCLGTMTVRDW